MMKSEIRNSKSEINLKFQIPIILLILLLLLVGCQRQQALPAPSNGPQVIPVKVAKVELRDLEEVLEYIGDIKAQDEALVYPKVSGKIIEKLKEDGNSVVKGEAIAYIDRDEVGLKFQKAPVESPLAGIIGRVYVDIGANVTNQTPVALVVDMDRVKISLEIPEKYLPRIFLKQKANISVDAYPGEDFAGEITKISPVVNVETRTAPVEISIDNLQHSLKSGMFARVSLVVERHEKVPIILKEAVMGREPELYVFVAENNKASLRKVKLGIRQGPYYEVTDGLNAGDLAVIMGQQRLTDGADVKVEFENNNN